MSQDSKKAIVEAEGGEAHVQGSNQSPEHMAIAGKGHHAVSAESEENGTEMKNQGYFDQASGKLITVESIAKDEAKLIWGVDKGRKIHWLRLLRGFNGQPEVIKSYWPALKEELNRLYGIKAVRDAPGTDKDKLEQANVNAVNRKTVEVYISHTRRVITAALKEAEVSGNGQWNQLIEKLEKEKNLTTFLKDLPALQVRNQNRAPDTNKAEEKLNKAVQLRGMKMVPIQPTVSKEVEETQNKLKDSLKTPEAAAVVEQVGHNKQGAFGSIAEFIKDLNDTEVLDRITYACATRWGIIALDLAAQAKASGDAKQKELADTYKVISGQILEALTLLDQLQPLETGEMDEEEEETEEEEMAEGNKQAVAE